jgi:hypothetical protein
VLAIVISYIYAKKITPLGKGIGAGTRAFYLKTSERGNTAELRNGENK